MNGRRRHGMDRMKAFANFRGSRSEGGAKPRVQANAIKAESESAKQGVPFLLAKMYASSPIINTDQTRDEGQGMVNNLYIPVTPHAQETERPLGQKLRNWFLKGKFA